MASGIPEFGVESQFLVIWDLKSSAAKLSDVKLLKTQNWSCKWSCNTSPKVTWANAHWHHLETFKREAARERERERELQLVLLVGSGVGGKLHHRGSI